MTYSEAYRKGIEILKDAGNDAPANDAGVLLYYAARCGRTYLYAHSGSELPEHIQQLFELVGKRAGVIRCSTLPGSRNSCRLPLK